MIQFLFCCFKIKDKYVKDEVTVYAAQASFFIILAIFPFLMLLMTLVQVIPGITKSDFLNVMVSLMPDLLDSLTVSIVDDLYTKSPATILSVTAIVALWSAGKGMMGIERGMNRIYESPYKRGYVMRRLICAVYTIVFMVVCLLSLGLLVFGTSLQRFIIRTFPLFATITSHLISFRSLLSLVLLLAVFTLLYTILPKKKQNPWKQIPGAAFAALGWMIFSYGFSIYFEHFSRFSYMYGSLTAIILLMLWLYFCICIVFIGAEINYFLESVMNSGVDR